MTKESDRPQPTVPASRGPTDHFERLVFQVTDFLRGYFWLVFKNVMGWLLILSSVPVGVLLPGPGGLPMFLIGFALVTFPGKRQLTSRVMRGRGLPIDANVFTILTALFAIFVTIAMLWIVGDRLKQILAYFHLSLDQQQSMYTALPLAFVVLGLIALLTTWITTRIGLRLVNFLLRSTPKIRRFIRPKMRQWGIDLLPARRKYSQSSTEEILEFSPSYQSGVQSVWAFAKPWLKRMFSLGITIWIFVAMFARLESSWPTVRSRLDEVSFGRFIVSSFMFAGFLFVFRALVWRHIVAAFGHTLPVQPALRIWITSELARYLPLSVWQVVGRAFLAKPYGVSGAICSTTQVLELCIFLLANLLVALTCLAYYGAKSNPEFRGYMYGAMLMTPLLSLILHPKIFYGIVNSVLRRIGRPMIIQRLRGKSLLKLLAWTILGLAWQSLAIFLICQPLLGLKFDWIWIVSGAYCLSWCAGFMAFWASGGLGVREGIFVLAMEVALPPSVKAILSGIDRTALLIFISFVLRAWTIAGELILTTVAYFLDIRGALGDPRAPGRLGAAR